MESRTWLRLSVTRCMLLNAGPWAAANMVAPSVCVMDRNGAGYFSQPGRWVEKTTSQVTVDFPQNVVVVTPIGHSDGVSINVSIACPTNQGRHVLFGRASGGLRPANLQALTSTEREAVLTVASRHSPTHPWVAVGTVSVNLSVVHALTPPPGKLLELPPAASHRTNSHPPAATASYSDVPVPLTSSTQAASVDGTAALPHPHGGGTWPLSVGATESAAASSIRRIQFPADYVGPTTATSPTTLALPQPKPQRPATSTPSPLLSGAVGSADGGFALERPRTGSVVSLQYKPTWGPAAGMFGRQPPARGGDTASQRGSLGTAAAGEAATDGTAAGSNVADATADATAALGDAGGEPADAPCEARGSGAAAEVSGAGSRPLSASAAAAAPDGGSTRRASRAASVGAASASPAEVRTSGDGVCGGGDVAADRTYTSLQALAAADQAAHVQQLAAAAGAPCEPNTNTNADGLSTTAEGCDGGSESGSVDAAVADAGGGDAPPPLWDVEGGHEGETTSDAAEGAGADADAGADGNTGADVVEGQGAASAPVDSPDAPDGGGECEAEGDGDGDGDGEGDDDDLPDYQRPVRVPALPPIDLTLGAFGIAMGAPPGDAQGANALMSMWPTADGAVPGAYGLEVAAADAQRSVESFQHARHPVVPWHMEILNGLVPGDARSRPNGRLGELVERQQRLLPWQEQILTHITKPLHAPVEMLTASSAADARARRGLIRPDATAPDGTRDADSDGAQGTPVAAAAAGGPRAGGTAAAPVVRPVEYSAAERARRDEAALRIQTRWRGVRTRQWFRNVLQIHLQTIHQERRIMAARWAVAERYQLVDDTRFDALVTRDTKRRVVNAERLDQLAQPARRPDGGSEASGAARGKEWDPSLPPRLSKFAFRRQLAGRPDDVDPRTGHALVPDPAVFAMLDGGADEWRRDPQGPPPAVAPPPAAADAVGGADEWDVYDGSFHDEYVVDDQWGAGGAGGMRMRGVVARGPQPRSRAYVDGEADDLGWPTASVGEARDVHSAHPQVRRFVDGYSASAGGRRAAGHGEHARGGAGAAAAAADAEREREREREAARERGFVLSFGAQPARVAAAVKRRTSVGASGRAIPPRAPAGDAPGPRGVPRRALQDAQPRVPRGAGAPMAAGPDGRRAVGARSATHHVVTVGPAGRDSDGDRSTVSDDAADAPMSYAPDGSSKGAAGPHAALSASRGSTPSLPPVQADHSAGGRRAARPQPQPVQARAPRGGPRSIPKGPSPNIKDVKSRYAAGAGGVRAPPEDDRVDGLASILYGPVE